MGLTGRDLYLVSPELALAALALAVVLLDVVVRRRGVVSALAVVGLAAPFALSVALWGEAHAAESGALSAFNGALVVDKFALFFKFLIVGTLALVLLASRGALSRYRRETEFIGLVMLSSTGLMLLGAAADLLTLYVALELASLPVAALAAFATGQDRSIEAGLKYLVLSAIASALLLMGFAYLYGASGTVRVLSPDGAAPTIAQMLAGGASAEVPFGGYALLVGVLLTIAGFGFKLSMVPFQMWTPDVYEGAPTPVGAFLSVASKAAGFAVLLRVLYEALGAEAMSADWTLLLAVLAVVTMSVGNMVAIAQTNVKRLLGYSAIAQAGYVLIGVAAFASRSQDDGGASLGAGSVLFYLAGYAAMNLAAFFVVIIVTERTGDERIDGLAGLGRRAPWLAGVLAFALLSLTGIPPTAGFMGKLFLFQAAINADLAWLAVAGAVNSVVSAYYYVNVIKTMYLREPEGDGEGAAARIPAGAAASLALAITGAATLALGVWPGPLFEAARTAAAGLL